MVLIPARGSYLTHIHEDTGRCRSVSFQKFVNGERDMTYHACNHGPRTVVEVFSVITSDDNKY